MNSENEFEKRLWKKLFIDALTRAHAQAGAYTQTWEKFLIFEFLSFFKENCPLCER